MITLIVNPTAGNGYAMKIVPKLRELLDQAGKSYQMLMTEASGHATALASEAAKDAGCEAVIAVGGDGTAFETACGVAGTGVPMGIVPAGTGNDFIKSLGTPSEPIEALRFILSHESRPVDLGRFEGRSFLNVCGTGFDVQVLDYTYKHKARFRGLLPYLIGLIEAMFHYRPVHLRITLEDGTVTEKDACVCSIANGRYFGGGIPICLPAKIDDGLLDVVLVDDMPRRRLPFFLPALLSGKITEKKITRHFTCRKIMLESQGMRVNSDGEIHPMDKAEFSVIPGALKMFW